MTLHTPIHVRQPDTPTHPPARLTVTSELKSGGTQQSGLLPHRNLSPASSEKRQAEGNAGPTLNRRATGKITGAFSPHFCQEQKDLAKGKPTGGCTPCSPGWVGASPRWGPRRLPTPESARFQHIHPPTRQDPGPGNPRRVLSLHRARESQRRQGVQGSVRGSTGRAQSSMRGMREHGVIWRYTGEHRGRTRGTNRSIAEHGGAQGARGHRGERGSTGDMGGTRGTSLGAQRHARDPGGRITWKSKCFQAGSTDQPSELAQGVGVCKNTRDQPRGLVMAVCKRHPEWPRGPKELASAANGRSYAPSP